jgi:hypothetical protein
VAYTDEGPPPQQFHIILLSMASSHWRKPDSPRRNYAPAVVKWGKSKRVQMKMSDPLIWQAVQCVVCRLLVRQGNYGGQREAVPGPHYPLMNQKTMTAHEADGSDMFSTYCVGSRVPGPVVMGDTSSAHEIADEDIGPVVLWEQGQDD